jgi:Na+/H+-dicarboxylate symporter
LNRPSGDVAVDRRRAATNCVAVDVLLWILALVLFLAFTVAWYVGNSGADRESNWTFSIVAVAILVAVAAFVFAVLALVWAILPGLE